MLQGGTDITIDPENNITEHTQLFEDATAENQGSALNEDDLYYVNVGSFNSVRGSGGLDSRDDVD
jgi:hypothetical protein